MVNGPALATDWPIIKSGYGVNFLSGDIPLSLFDQGRADTGAYHGMGVGIKVTEPRFVRSRGAAVARQGDRVLTFVVVARTSGDVASAERVLRRRGVGGESGYGVLRDGNTNLLYDIARSTAWFANTASDASDMNLTMVISRLHPWTAFLWRAGSCGSETLCMRHMGSDRRIVRRLQRRLRNVPRRNRYTTSVGPLLRTRRRACTRPCSPSQSSATALARGPRPPGPAPIRCKKPMCFLVNSAKCPPQAKNFLGRSTQHRQAAWHHRTALTTGRSRRSDVASYFRRAGPAALAG